MVGIRSVSHFFSHYAVYITLVVLGVFGLGTNLFARTIRPDEVGQGAAWATFQQGDGALIVESGTGKPPVVDNLTEAAVGGPAIAETKTLIDTAVSAPIDNLAAVGGASELASTKRDTVVQYTVQGGDTVSTIAANFGISSQTILWANGLGAGDFIKPGQVLKIPSVTGYLYTVKSGDTLAKIAATYKGDQDQILAANDLPLAEAIQAGQTIIIPGGQPPAPPAPPKQTIIASAPTFSGGTPPPSIAATGAKFVWPTVSHRINQYYRGRYHTGIDIDGDTGTPEYAAAAGTVTYASADRSGYGLHVVIDHGNGYITLYGHASKLYVQRGQHVNQGQTIAAMGCTGRCTGPHLHFEIRYHGGFLNPLSFY